MNPTYNARTDRNRNPAAFTTDIAKQAGLVEGIDYQQGDPFLSGAKIFFTAKLLGDPVVLTIRVIDAIGFYAKSGGQRWIYIGIPGFVWEKLDQKAKARVVGFMYHNEGGTEMAGLFAG